MSFLAKDILGPGFVEIYGDTDTGKTHLALEAALCQRHAVFLDLEHKGVPPALQSRDILVVQPSTAEDVFRVLGPFTAVDRTGIVIDSLAALSLSQALADGYQASPQPYRLSRLFVRQLRTLLHPLYAGDSTVFLVNQLREMDATTHYLPLGRHYPLFCTKRVHVAGWDAETAHYRGSIKS